MSAKLCTEETAMVTLSHHAEITLPSAQDVQLALASTRALAPLLGREGALNVPLRLSAGGVQAAEIDLPMPIARLLLGALQEMAAGNAVTLLPVPAELTTQQAAQFLRVSRPSLIKMLDAGKLPYRKVGAHRRVRYEDALLYVQNERHRRAQVMAELVAETERLGLYE
jgi:excisionase family DNA binding protein